MQGHPREHLALDWLSESQVPAWCVMLPWAGLLQGLAAPRGLAAILGPAPRRARCSAKLDVSAAVPPWSAGHSVLVCARRWGGKPSPRGQGPGRGVEAAVAAAASRTDGALSMENSSQSCPALSEGKERSSAAPGPRSAAARSVSPQRCESGEGGRQLEEPGWNRRASPSVTRVPLGSPSWSRRSDIAPQLLISP